MTTAAIRIAGPADVPALAALRRAWAAEQAADDAAASPAGEAADDGFEARFLGWYEQESARRVHWLAEIAGHSAGMINLVTFDRMPKPGRDASRWGYLSNAFVLSGHRGHGVGSLLLSALLSYADDHGYVRVVLSPSARAIPFYQRAGFRSGEDLLVRYRPA